MTFTADDLWALWGIVLSLSAAYLPFVSDWYEATDKRVKPLIMLGGLFLLCAGKMLVQTSFDWPAIEQAWPAYLRVFGEAVLANMITYSAGVRQFQKAAEDRQALADRLNAVTPQEQQ